MNMFYKFTALVAAIWMATALPAYADRKPTPAERKVIENQLIGLGYVSWDEIEFDTRRNAWEIDDARTADGREYDLRLAPNTFEVLSRKLDD